MFAKNISVMISEKELADRVAELGKQITEDYRNRSNKLLFVGILKGSVVFLSDLIRAVDLPLTIDFMIASSYGSQTTSDGVVTIRKDIAQDLTGYDIIIVEDILDSGFTLDKICNVLRGRNAESVRICTLLEKPARRKVHIDVDYCGFSIEDQFIVGYGLDYDQQYRNLPFIGVVEGID